MDYVEQVAEARKWKVTLFREPQEPPFDHPFSVESPEGEKWVARTLAAAFRLIDTRIFLAAHPELKALVGGGE